MDNTSERIDPSTWLKDGIQHILYLRHLFAYTYFKQFCDISFKCLDYGCGNGYGSYLLSDVVKEIYCVDVDHLAIDRARSKYHSQKNNIFFQVINGKSLPFKDNMFDIVFSSQVIEHLREPQKYLAEAWRVIKPGGLLLLTTPNKTYRLKGNEKPWNRFHVEEYGARELELLLKNRFKQIKIFGIFANDEIDKLEMRRIKRRRILNLLDIFNLRRLILPGIEYKVISTMQNISTLFSKTNSNNSFDHFSIRDFYADNKNLDKSFDLISVCQK